MLQWPRGCVVCDWVKKEQTCLAAKVSRCNNSYRCQFFARCGKNLHIRFAVSACTAPLCRASTQLVSPYHSSEQRVWRRVWGWCQGTTVFEVRLDGPEIDKPSPHSLSMWGFCLPQVPCLSAWPLSGWQPVLTTTPLLHLWTFVQRGLHLTRAKV